MTDSVTVIGGGAVGLQAAITLADRGVAVTLFEQGELGSGASGRAAGICYDAYADRRDADIAAESIQYFEDAGLLTRRPYLWFARDDCETADAIAEQAAGMIEQGRDVELLDRETVADRFPALVTEDIETAALAADAGVLDPETYLDHLAARARTAGVSIHTDTAATVTEDRTVRAEGRETDSDAVLVAAGAGTPGVLENLDSELALGRYRTQALVTGPVDGTVPIYYDVSTERYARPMDDGILAGDGSELYHGDPVAFDRTADESFLSERRDGLADRLGEEIAVQRSWAGLCTATPDRDPLLGELEPGVFVATGFCGHGLMRSPALGRTVATQMLGADPLSGFEPTRFDGDESIALPVGIDE